MSRKFLVLTIGLIGALLLASCATPTPEVIEKVVTKEVEKVVEKVVTQVVKETVKETVIVEGTPQVVEKEVTKIVEVVSAPTFDTTGPKYGGTLTWGVEGCCRDVMDQDKSNNTQCRYMGRHVLETLTVVDPATGEIRPGLATSWEASDDGREITFKLRQGVKFHDGTPFNAEAVKFNFDRTMSLPPKAAWQYMGGEKFKEAQVIDEYTVKMVFNEPYAGLLVMLSDGALGIDSPAGVEQYGDEYGVKGLVGTGPFMWVEWVKDDHMTFVRNPDYAWAPEFYKHQGPAYLEELTCRDFPEFATLAAAVEVGEVDVARINENDAATFQELPGFSVQLTPKAGTTRYYMMNMDRPPTDDFAVREAIQYAIDKQGIIDTPRFAGIGNVGVSPLPSNMVPGGVSEFAPLNRPYDPEKAKALLEEAGWVDTDGDGVREKDGQPCVVEMVIPEQDLMFVEPAAGMLKAVGIEMEIVSGDFNAWIEAGTTGEFHMMTMSDSGYEGPTLLWNFYHSAAPYAFTRLKDEKLDEYLDKATVTVDPDERWGYVREAMKIIVEESATVDVMELMYVFVVNEKVQDLFFAELGYPYAYDTWVKK